MKIRKKIKIGLISVLSAVALLFIVLIVHIGIMVHERGALPMATIQMARVDFQNPITPLQAKNIEADFKHYKGVKSTHFNVKNGILIYTFDNRKNSTKAIYSNFEKENSLPCSRYVVSDEDLSHGCPAMNSNSFYGKLTNVISKIVN